MISKHVAVNNNSADGVLQHTEFNKSTYHSITGQVLKTWHKSDNSAWTISCAYVYDELGRVSKKSLGNGGEVQDIGYDINGRLKGINAIYAETGNKQGVSRSFGESIKYDYGFDNIRFDGKIAGIVWRGSAADRMNAYGYSYALDGSLLNADFNAVNGDNPTWGKNGIDYSVDNIAYDKNGNLTSMFQKGTDLSTNTQDYVDMLEYQYEDNGVSNRLQSVFDNAPIINDELGDFKNDNMGNTGDYDYDANGNLVRDANKNIGSDVAVTYTRFNKPAVIRFDNGGVIYNSYDAAGNKVQEVVFDPTVGTTKAKDYIGNYVYDEDALSYALTADGRTVYENGAPVREEFFVKDHLGNVRSTVNVISYQIRQYLASYEIASSNLGNLIFDGIDQVRDYKPGGLGDNTMAANLDGADPERRIGSSLLVHVMAGDNVNLHVNTYYNGYDSEDDNPVNAQDMLESVITTLTGGQGGFEGSESHEVSLVDKVFSPDNYLKFTDLVNTQGVDAAKPKAFLNYILFNERMEMVSSMTGAFQANGDGTWSEKGTATALEVPENGYLAVYLSNASQQLICPGCSHVYFDQLRVEISKGNLLEETHYYPFGLPIVGLGSVDVPQNFKENRHKYQGNEYIKAIGLNWMDFQARQYDPQIGRFLGVDPLAASGGQDMFSPYAAMGNAPESTIDPNGEMFQPVKSTTNTFSPVEKQYRGDEGGPGSGGGGGYGGDIIGATLNAFGLEGCANIMEYAAMKQQEAMTGAENNQDQAPVANGEEKKSGDDVVTTSSTPQSSSSVNNSIGGVTIRVFRQLTPEDKKLLGIGSGNEGIVILLGYNDVNSMYTDLQWVQTVSSNVLFPPNTTSPFVDGEAPPFYRSSADQQNNWSNIDGYNSVLLDAPNRSIYNATTNVVWNAELSLVGRVNGRYITITTMTYGFSVQNNQVSIFNPTMVTTPSPFHINILNSLP